MVATSLNNDHDAGRAEAAGPEGASYPGRPVAASFRVAMKCADGGTDETLMYLTLFLNNGHLTVVAGQARDPGAPPVSMVLCEVLMRGLFSVICPDVPHRVDVSEMPDSFYDAFIEGCRDSLPRFPTEKSLRRKYLGLAFDTGNLTVVERYRRGPAGCEEDMFRPVYFGANSEPFWGNAFTPDEARKRFGAVAIDASLSYDEESKYGPVAPRSRFL
jgi:hypothetical protein